jgi:hypothetical protein
MLTWGDQQIPEPVDEVADIYVISYDQKRKAIIQRIQRKEGSCWITPSWLLQRRT